MGEDYLFDMEPLAPLEPGELVMVRTIIGHKPARVVKYPFALEVEVEWVLGARPWRRGSRTRVHLDRVSRP